MLFLTRLKNEWVDIRDTRTNEVIGRVSVADIKKNGFSVRLGFEGPPHIQFLRHDAHKRDHQPEKGNGDSKETHDSNTDTTAR